MKTQTLLFAILMPVLVMAQGYPVGYREISVYDSNRERDITAYAYYPAVQAEENASPVEGTFPYIVFGHGFMMNQGDYDYLYNYLVPKGYFFVSLTTETGASPDHETYAQDLAFVCDNFYDLMLDDVVFHDCVGPKCVVMGRMGGGASHLASSYSQQMEAVITFAAAETDPSAIEAVANANVDLLIFSGQGDAVTPPEENQIPMYEASNSDCKSLITVLGGIHCYFAESQWACDFGETISGSDAGIEREEQHDIVTDFLDMYLDAILKSNYDARLAFVDSLSNSSRVEVLSNCNYTGYNNPPAENIKIFPNPAKDVVYFENIASDSILKIIDIHGKTKLISTADGKADLSSFPESVYFIQVYRNDKLLTSSKLIITR